MHLHHILLSLHGELLGNNDIVKILGVLYGFPDNMLTGIVSFAYAGAADNKLQGHVLSSF